MKITRLFGTDLFSYERLDLNLADRGLLLVEGENLDLGGSNGSGKSNIFKSIAWILYGKAPQDGGTISGDDVIREDIDHTPVVGNTSGYVEVSTESSSLQIYRHRGHSQYGNKLLLYADGNDVTMGSDAETQSRLLEYLGTDYDAFVHAVMFPQDASSFASLTDASQKSIFDSILGSERFAVGRKKAQAQLKLVLGDFQRKQVELGSINSQIGQLDEQLRDLTSKQDQWAAELAARTAAAEQNLAAIESAVPASDTDVVDQYRQHLAHLQTSLAGETTDALRKQKSDLTIVYTRLQALAGECQTAVQAVETWTEPIPTEYVVPDWLPQQAMDAESNRRSAVYLLSQEEAKLANNTSGICPTCGQKMASQELMRAHVEQEIAKLRNGVESSTAAAQMLRKQLEAAEIQEDIWREYQEHLRNVEKRQKAEQRLHEVTTQMSEIVVQGKAVAEKLKSAELRDQIVTYLEQVDRAYGQWEYDVKNAKLKIEELRAEVSPYADMSANAKQQLEQRRASLYQISKQIDELDSQITGLRFWEAGFGPKGVRSLLLDHVTPELNRIANEYLDILSSGTATMAFHTTKTLKSGESRDNFHVAAEYRNGAGSYKKISGGERQRPDLAAMFALGDLAAARSRSPIQLRLLDEPFDGLDSIGAEQVVEVLRTKVLPKVGTIFVMTHDDNLKQLIDNRIIVVKEGGISKILS